MTCEQMTSAASSRGPTSKIRSRSLARLFFTPFLSQPQSWKSDTFLHKNSDALYSHYHQIHQTQRLESTDLQSVLLIAEWEVEYLAEVNRHLQNGLIMGHQEEQ
jgi:hypothetical protein